MRQSDPNREDAECEGEAIPRAYSSKTIREPSHSKSTAASFLISINFERR
jgi:hypothetical protein